jgi:hypothetical protein
MRVYIITEEKELVEVFEKENVFNKDGSYSQPIKRAVKEAIEKGHTVMTVPHNSSIRF